MKTVGLIGGIASGKSAVAEEFERLGAVVLNADRAVHQILEDERMIAQLVERWGPDILTNSGQIDRARIAQIVFAGNDAAPERHFLEKLTHPLIAADFQRQIAEFSQTSTPCVVVDAALLLEAGWAKMCDAILFIEVEHSRRLERAISTRGWTVQEFAKREASQLPIEEKRARATHVLDNSGTREELRAEVQRFWNSQIASR